MKDVYLKPYFDLLAPMYKEYTATIIDRGQSSSLRVCAMLCHLMIKGVPEGGAVVEFGCGATSVAVRMAKKHFKAVRRIKTIDSTEMWLYHTKDLCERYKIGHSGFGVWGKFKPVMADLMFYKLGRSHERGKYLSEALGYLKPGGLLLVDDYHKATVRDAFEKEFTEQGIEYESVPGIWKHTKDPLGRYAVLLKLQALADPVTGWDDHSQGSDENNG